MARLERLLQGPLAGLRMWAQPSNLQPAVPNWRYPAVSIARRLLVLFIPAAAAAPMGRGSEQHQASFLRLLATGLVEV